MAKERMIWQAKWEVWKDIPYATIEELVALSLDKEPELANTGRFPNSELSSRYRERKLVATRNFGIELHRAENAPFGFPPKVSMTEFAKWAKLKAWDLPPQLEALAAAGVNVQPVKETVADPVEKPLEESERVSLLKIIFGLAKKHYYYDPTKERHAAAQNIRISLQTVGVKISDDTIRKYLREAASKEPNWRDEIA